MKIHRLLSLGVLLLLIPLKQGFAEITLLAHGYMSDPGIWETSRVNDKLRQDGWQYAGNLGYSPAGLLDNTKTLNNAEKRFYTVQLPALAPAAIQASWLNAALQHLAAQYPDESVNLVGHSAGGVVARLTLVQYGVGKVRRLVTIAAPHLGTDKAIQALNASNDSGMFGFLKKALVKDAIGNDMYNTLRHSRGILIDLTPPAPGSMLFWLNAQAHPDIEYISIIRSAGYNIAGDIAVPPFSQDMNQIPVLAGRSRSIIVLQGHELTPHDGKLLADIL
jgi:triacylglycerol lipase